MQILTVDHITINLEKKEESFAFYENVFGLKKADEKNMGDHILHLYQLPGVILELIEYLDDQKTVHTEPKNKGVYRHFAVTVDDLGAFHDACVKAGYGINMEPEFVEGLGKTVMLIKDPNGVEIELIQA
ncbi:MAG: VOC family protein [Blautia sp.]|nr:VOC family protein [Blautia sp.]